MIARHELLGFYNTKEKAIYEVFMINKGQPNRIFSKT